MCVSLVEKNWCLPGANLFISLHVQGSSSTCHARQTAPGSYPSLVTKEKYQTLNHSTTVRSKVVGEEHKSSMSGRRGFSSSIRDQIDLAYCIYQLEYSDYFIINQRGGH